MDAQQLLDQAAELPYGEAKTTLLERALREADRELAIQIRMDLTEAYQYGAEPAKSFVTFSRSVAEFDAEPGRFTDWQQYNLLWQYKWICSDMRRFHEVPLQRAYDALAEMERRYRLAGHGLHAVYGARAGIAAHLGDREAAEEWFQRWQITPRDDMSDCEGCDPSHKVALLSWMGRYEEAIELAAPVVAGELTCHVQPQGILTNLLVPYLRTGRFAEAVTAHLRAYRIVQGDANYVEDFGDHLQFCALTGNEARGLEILERELPLLERSPTPGDRLHLAGCAALLLGRVEALGQGGLTVRGETVSALRIRLEGMARDLAARFDARNGTGEQTRRLEARLATEPFTDHLPLVPHARRTPAPQPVVRSDDWALPLIEEVAARTARGDSAGAAVARVELCAAYADTGRPLEALITGEEALAMLPEDDADNRLAVRRVMVLTQLDLGEHDAALAVLTELAEDMATHGYHHDAAVMTEQRADTLDKLDRDAEAAALFAEVAVSYERLGDQDGRARALRRHALSLYWAGEEEASLDAIRAARTTLDRLDDPTWERAAHDREEANILRFFDRDDEATELLRSAVAGFRAAGDEESARTVEGWLD
ncbi:hypothetical protein ACIBG8_13760 [Nonomuraea sp. NPDC050556]|uniref:hypothetical protein n=1 Tax=Nonomuraea sp. NPDC050556 TaxID=3364369 RepID=UPI00379F18BF